jgi:uncharacterized protein with HEPN domain
MSKRDDLLLQDMLDSANKIKKYTKNLDYEKFIKDDKTVDATVRNFEIIGEAANRIDPAFKAQNPDIEWEKMRGFRNRIVHAYFGIDYKIVWSIIENNLDELIYQVEALIEEYNDS